MSGLDMPAEVKDRYLALVKLIERTGAASYRIEHTDPANGVVMWIAISEHQVQRPRGESGKRRVPSAGAGSSPLIATQELAGTLIDGGQCAHCSRPSALEALGTPLEDDLDSVAVPTSDGFVSLCWYRYDPELRTYRRSCEGDAE